jgi:hypothetical protein
LGPQSSILDPGPGDNGGGGGGGDQPTYEQVDAEADNLARSIESLIKSDPNYQSYEIGAVTYKDANTGELKSSPLAQGSPSDPQSLEYPLREWGIEPSQIVGMIHSHPAGAFNSNVHEVNKHPPDNRTVNGTPYEGQDWTIADKLRDGGMNHDTFRHYIIGHDDVTREYDFNNRDAETPGSGL